MGNVIILELDTGGYRMWIYCDKGTEDVVIIGWGDVMIIGQETL